MASGSDDPQSAPQHEEEPSASNQPDAEGHTRVPRHTYARSGDSKGETEYSHPIAFCRKRGLSIAARCTAYCSEPVRKLSANRR